MMYVGEKISKIKNAKKTISIFDSNWGLLEKDIKLADHILKVMEKYDWPQDIECLVPKSNWKNILKINDILKNRVACSLSMQSLQVETLTDIKRTNWTMFFSPINLFSATHFLKTIVDFKDTTT